MTNLLFEKCNKHDGALEKDCPDCVDWLVKWAKAAEFMIQSAKTSLLRWRELDMKPSRSELNRVIDRLTYHD